MVNKLTIENAWKQDPFKSYYVIQNPKIDKKKQKISGLSIKYVEYRVKDWDDKFVRFEKVNKLKNKRFADIISFDKRYPDAENEVYAEKVSKAKTKPDTYVSYGIFIDPQMATYHKLIRLHRLAEDMAGIYKALKNNEINSVDNETNNSLKSKKKKTDTSDKGEVISKEAEDDIKSGVSNKVTFSIDEVKKYFEEIQNTDYFTKLEDIQIENPDLATK